MPVIPFKSHAPDCKQALFIAPDAWISGDVSLAKDTVVLFGAVLRGDIQPIKVGSGTNLQDHCMLHTSTGLGPCLVGKDVTVGHRAILHGCKIGDRCIIGMGAIILDNAEIGDECIIGANALVTMNTKIPPRSMVMGSPAKVTRQLRDDEIEGIKENARHYIQTGSEYARYFADAPKHL